MNEVKVYRRLILFFFLLCLNRVGRMKGQNNNTTKHEHKHIPEKRVKKFKNWTTDEKKMSFYRHDGKYRHRVNCSPIFRWIRSIEKFIRSFFHSSKIYNFNIVCYVLVVRLFAPSWICRRSRFSLVSKNMCGSNNSCSVRYTHTIRIQMEEHTAQSRLTRNAEKIHKMRTLMPSTNNVAKFCKLLSNTLWVVYCDQCTQ